MIIRMSKESFDESILNMLNNPKSAAAGRARAKLTTEMNRGRDHIELGLDLNTGKRQTISLDTVPVSFKLR